MKSLGRAFSAKYRRHCLKQGTALLLVLELVLTVLFVPCGRVYAKGETAEEILASMTTEQKITQMMMIALPRASDGQSWGMTELSGAEQALFMKYGFGGVILYRDNLTDTLQGVRLVNAIQEANAVVEGRTSMFMAVDQEGGRVWRLPSGTKFSGNMALAATGDSSNAMKAGQIIGSELVKMGFNVDFAPVVDVNSNPSNPVIDTRSFSDDALTVANYSVAEMQGLQSGEDASIGGVTATLKHFPGHGDTSVDSHSGLPVIYKTYDELKKNELIPFQACIDAGTDMIMTAHISFPNIEPATYPSLKDGVPITLPASLSGTMLGGILRGDMGYDGVVVTDALNMGAIAENFSALDASRLAIAAGADILLQPVSGGTEGIEAYIAQMVSMVENGQIDRNRVDQSVLRILKLKEKKGLLGGYNESGARERTEGAASYVGSKAHLDVEWDIVKKSITLVKNKAHTLPLDGSGRTTIMVPADERWQSVQDGIDRLKKEGILAADANVSITSYANLSADQMIERTADAKNVVVFTLANNIDSLKALNAEGEPNISGKIDTLINALKEKEGVRITVVCYGLPYEAARYPDADAIMLCWNSTGIPAATYLAFKKDGDGADSTVYPATTVSDGSIASVDVSITGTLPISIPKINSEYAFGETKYKRGFGLCYAGNLAKVRGANMMTIPRINTVRLQKKSASYTGSAQKPEVIVRDRNGSSLVEGSDYTVVYDKGFKDVGAYNVQVSFRGNYSGLVSLPFEIRPKKTRITELDRDYNGFSVSWEKRTRQTDGYQIQYGTGKYYEKNSKIATVKSNKTGEKTISELKDKTLYFVRIRTFKTLPDGKTLYSPWSSLKKVKTY